MGLTQLGASGGGSSTLDTNTATSGLSGLLKSASNTLDVAVAGTDYLEPSAIGTIATQAANSVAITGGSITGISALGASAGTLTASTPFTLAQTWNNAGVTFTGLLFNVTNTASASGSLFASFQVGGTDVITLRRDGGIIASSLTVGSNSAVVHVSGAYGNATGLTGNSIDARLAVYGTGPVLLSNGSLQWVNSSANTQQPRDLILGRGDAATLQLGELHATTPTSQTIRAHGVTTGTGASLTLQGGSGSVARGNVVLHGGNRAAYDAAPSTTVIRDILISHGLMAAS